jgi:hypothetical protein
MKALYPIFLKLEQKKILFVGGGSIAAQKIQSLLDAGCHLTVISPCICKEIHASLLETVKKVERILSDSSEMTLDEYLERRFEKQNNRNRYNILVVCDDGCTYLYSYSLDTKEEILSIVKRLLVWYPSVKGIQIVNLKTGEMYWSTGKEGVQKFIDFLEDGNND